MHFYAEKGDIVNVIVANTQQSVLSNLDTDVIKSINGSYSAYEIVGMFKNFFFNKMVLDVTAIKDYTNISNYQTLATGLDSDKIIYFLPENSSVCTASFLSTLVSMGIYNFTSNFEGVRYLLKHSNTYKDVAQYQKIAPVSVIPNGLEEEENGSEQGSTEETVSSTIKTRVIGIKNITESAGATTLIYMLKRQLTSKLGQSVIAVELDKSDFKLFNEKNMFSISKSELGNFIAKYRDASLILVDLNSCTDELICETTLYLIEPSVIKLNKLLRTNSSVLGKLKDKKVVLNKSLLSNKDVTDFEYESNLKIFYNIPPLDDRKYNEILNDLMHRLGAINQRSNNRGESNRVFGLFRR